MRLPLFSGLILLLAGCVGPVKEIWDCKFTVENERIIELDRGRMRFHKVSGTCETPFEIDVPNRGGQR